MAKQVRRISSNELQRTELCACFNLRKATRAVTAHFDEYLRPVGLRATQFTLMTVVAKPDRTMVDVADELGMDRTTLLRNLRALVDDGLIEVTPQGGRQSYLLELTNEGLQLLREAMPLWKKAQATAEKALGFADYAVFVRTMEHVAERLAPSKE